MQAFPRMQIDPLSPVLAARRLPGAVPGVVLSTAALAVAALAAQQQLALRGLYVPVVLGAFLLGAAVVLRAALRHAEASFGAANQVTLIRGALTSLVAGLLIAETSAAVLWFAIAVAGLALLLDGVDGSVARRRGSVSAFGARFDMETDALSIVVLAALVWHFDKAGAWVMLSALLRYAFVAAGRAWPWMRAPLPPSRRRQTVCVVQIGALLVCLVPFVPAEESAAIAAAALVMLAASFAIDTCWLARHAVPRGL